MATMMLYASVFLSLLTVAATNCTAQQVVHQKLEDALLGNSQALYLMQKVFFPLQWFPPTSVVIRVCLTVGGAVPGHCDKHSSFSGVSSNFSYWQQFQWSSSALVFLISIDQLIALDNVISATIYLLNNSPHYHLPIQLHVDSLPSGITEDDLLEGMIELLTWVRSVCEQFICIL